MKGKAIIVGFIMSVIGCMVVSCEVTTSDNGHLDGYWHLVNIDSLQGGGSVDLSEELFFWAYQHHFMVTVDRRTETSNIEIIYSFEHQDNTLRVFNPHISDRWAEDPDVTETEPLTPYGINSLDETFVVETLTGSRMILRSSSLRLYFRKM